MTLNFRALPTTLAVAVAGLSTAALAQDSLPNTRINGYVELEYLDGDFDGQTFLLGDVDLSMGLPGGGFGFDLGLHAIVTEDDDLSALYGAATYTMGAHKIAVGVPRSAYDSLNAMPAIGGNRTFDLQLTELNGGLTEYFYLLDIGDTPYGLRYDGGFGNLAVAASAHWFEGEDVDSQAIAFRYSLPSSGFSILGDAERFNIGDADITTTRIGAEADFGQYKGGLSYFNRDPDGSSHIDGTETWFSYLPTDRITVTGTALNTNVFDVYGLSLQYGLPVGDSFPGGAYAQIGAIDGRDTDTVYDLSVGFEF